MDTLRRSKKKPYATYRDREQCKINEYAQVFVHDLDRFVTVQFLDEGVLTMFESSVSHVSHDDFALQIEQIESKESMHRETDC